MALATVKQQNIAVNRARNLIFFEGTELCYNYKTGQWTDCPAYLDIAFYSINSKNHDIGTVIFSSGSVALQPQSVSYPAPAAVITTGASDLNPGGRSFVSGVRPRVNGGTYAVRVGVQDNIDDTVTWSTSTSVNTRSGMANFRSEGRYVRSELTITGGFDTAIGIDFDFTEQGRV